MRYGKASREAVESAQVGGADFWGPPSGESRIRIMPPWAEDIEEFWYVTGTHFNVGPDERAVPCPSISGVRDTCFLCRLVKRLSRGDADERAEAEAMSARPRYLINIVHLDKPQDGVQVWPAPVTIFRQLKKFWLNDNDYGDFTSLDDGFDIIISKEGSGINTDYDATPARKNTPFPDDKLLNHRNQSIADLYQAIADQEFELPDLSEVQTFIEDDEMERVYKGLSGGRARIEAKEENGDEPEARSGRRSRRVEPEDKEAEGRPSDRTQRSASEEKAEDDDERQRNPRRDSTASEDDDSSDDERSSRGTRKSRPSSDKGGSESRSRIRGRVKDLS